MMIIISMKLLLTMCFHCFATGPNNLRVIQTPTNINLSIGDYAEMACVWEKAIVRYRASWYLVNKANITRSVSSKLLCPSNTTHENKDVLVIKSANVNDTGFYYCEIIIEIPFFKKLCGNGTTVIVGEKEAHSLDKRYLITWAILPFLVAVASLCLCYKKSSTPPYLAVSVLYEPLEVFCNESRGKDDKSTATIVSNGADEQIPQTRAAEKSRMRQGSDIYFDIQN